MGWREKQRSARKKFDAATWPERIREAWNHLTGQERIEFLAELEQKAQAAYAGAAVTHAWVDEAAALTPAEPGVPAYNAAVEASGGDPLTRALYTHTQLVQAYPGGEH